MKNPFVVIFKQNQREAEKQESIVFDVDKSATFRNLVSLGMIVCLITMILGTSVFVVAGEAGGRVGYILGYVGGAFRRFTLYFSVPLWLLSWFTAHSRQGWRINFDIPLLFYLIAFACYTIAQLLLANISERKFRLESLFQILPIILMTIPLSRPRNCKLFWYGLVMAGVLFFVSLSFSGQFLAVAQGKGLEGLSVREQGRIALGKDVISSASMVYQCSLAGLLWVLTYPRRSFVNLMILVSCSGLLVMGIMTGSRGPLVSFVVAFFSFLVVNRKLGLKWFYGAAVIILLYWFVVGPLLADYHGAYKHLIEGMNDQTRLMYIMYIIHSVPTLFGNGAGSFPLDSYPHNSILEVYYEMGIAGLLLFIGVLLNLFRKMVVLARHEPVAAFILAYFVYAFTLSMFSGSVLGDAELWVAVVFGCTRFVKFRQTSKKIKLLKPLLKEISA